MTTFNASNAIHILNKRLKNEVFDVIYTLHEEHCYLRDVIYCIGASINQIKYTRIKGAVRFRYCLLQFLTKDMNIIKIIDIYAKLKSSTT